MVAIRLALASLGLAGLAGAAPIQPRQTCYAGVYMIVGRGTDEPVGEGTPGPIANLVQSQLPNSGSVAVNYPAAIIDPPYPISVSDGVTNVISLIESYVNACGSKSKIALIGFSQGGNVMTDTLAGGVDKPTPISTAYSKYITAITVLGDPSFTVGQSFDRGTATRSGIFSRGGSSLELLNTYAPRLLSFCNSGDPFCASGLNGTVHTHEIATYETAAAAFIVSKNQ